MTQDSPRRPDPARPELLEGTDARGPRVVPLAVTPVSRLRSPIMEHRRSQPERADEERPTLLVPPLRTFIGPSGIALLAAAPLLLVVGWQAALVAGVLAPALREVHRLAARVTFSFGDGFLPYRVEDGWPQGVQEEDEVRWKWSPTSDGGRARG
jgi:hypothetical protein